MNGPAFVEVSTAHASRVVSVDYDDWHAGRCDLSDEAKYPSVRGPWRVPPTSDELAARVRELEGQLAAVQP